MTQKEVEELKEIIADLKRQRQKAADRIWDIAMKACVPAVVFISGMVISHEIWIAKTEGNRFTDKDANAMERRIKNELPPDWLREDIAEIKKRLSTIESKVR